MPIITHTEFDTSYNQHLKLHPFTKLSSHRIHLVQSIAELDVNNRYYTIDHWLLSEALVHNQRIEALAVM